MGGGHGPMAMMKGEKARDFKGTMRQLLQYLGAYKIGILIVILFAVASTTFMIVGPKLLGKATTKLFEGVMGEIAGTGTGIDFAYIGQILLLTLALYLGSALFALIQGWIMSHIAMDITYRFRKDIADKINRMPFKYFDNTSQGEVLSRITNDVDTVSQTLNQSLTQIITSVVTVIGVLIMMLTISWLMTLVALLIVPVSMGVIALVVSQSQKYFKQQQDYLGHINGHVEEMFGGHVVMKAFNGEAESVERFDGLNDTLFGSAWKSQFLSGLMMPIMQFVGNLGYVAIAIMGGYMAAQGAITVGDIQAFIQYMRMFTQPLTQIANISNVFQQTAAAAERVFEFLAEDEEIPDTLDPVLPEAIEGHVEFQNVRFGYDEDKEIIHDFSADIEPGQRIAIVGPTGAGKTTMVKLLMRFYDVDEGAILVDGTNVKEFRREDLRCMFGMVLQDTWLYNDTIMENIRYGWPGASDDEVIAAAQGRPGRPLCAHPARGLRSGDQRRGHQYLPGPEAAPDHRPRHPARPQDADPGRGDQFGRYAHRGLDPGSHVQPDEGPHQFHHRAPPVHHPQRRSDPGDGRGRYRRTGQARRTAGPRRLLRRAL